MEMKILCPQWGHEHLDVEDFFTKVKSAGYDGVETWLPEDTKQRKRFIDLLSKYELAMISHQHQATGSSIGEYCASFERYLNISMESNPILINSHSGRDYFTLNEQLQVLDVAEKFAIKNNITVAHETHRGRIGYCPQNAQELFSARPDMKVVADLSHWVCVTESYLENFAPTIQETIKRTAHIHARVGFTEGPQIPDPRSAFWQKEVDFFTALWQQMLDYQKSIGTQVFTITPEFGPPPYLWTDSNTNEPVASQWDINVFIKDLLKELYD